MYVLKAYNFIRNDCTMLTKCEKCEHEHEDKYAYNDENYRVNVVPSRECPQCKHKSK